MNVIHSTLLVMVCSAAVSSKAILKVTLLRYEANEDRCCDGINFFGTCNDCDPYFKVCLRQREAGKETCTVTSRENNKYTIDLASSGISPRIFQLPLDTLKKALSINIKTKDYDQASKDDDMDTLNYDFNGNSTSSPVKVTMRGVVSKYNTRITIDININCEQNYFGSKCDRFCKNNTRSICDSSGSRFCLTGYTGRSCESEIPPNNKTVMSIDNVSSVSVTQQPNRTAGVNVSTSKLSMSTSGRHSTGLHSTQTPWPISVSSTIAYTLPNNPVDKTASTKEETSTEARPSISFQSILHLIKVSPTVSRFVGVTKSTLTGDGISTEKSQNQQSTRIAYIASRSRNPGSQAVYPTTMTSSVTVLQPQVTTDGMISLKSQNQQSTKTYHTDSMHKTSLAKNESLRIMTASTDITQPFDTRESTLTQEHPTSTMNAVKTQSNSAFPNSGRPSTPVTLAKNVTDTVRIFPETSSSLPPSSTSKGFQVTDAIKVNCNEFGWDIKLDVDMLKIPNPAIKPSDIYLGKNLCHGKADGKILSFNQGLRECLTSETISGSRLIYRNELIYAVPDLDHPFIIRHYNWTVRVECNVYRNETATGHILHDAASNTSLQVAGETHYAVSMSFYKDPGYMTEIPGNPLHVHVGTLVYVKVYTIAPAFTVKMVVKDCYTKISENVTDATSFYLIKNGCEKDINTHIISRTGHEMKFVFEDFQYTSSQDGHYLFCDAVFCGASDNSARCQQRCETKKKRSVTGNSIKAASTKILSSAFWW